MFKKILLTFFILSLLTTYVNSEDQHGAFRRALKSIRHNIVPRDDDDVSLGTLTKRFETVNALSYRLDTGIYLDYSGENLRFADIATGSIYNLSDLVGGTNIDFWKTITSDSGNAVADIANDTLTIAGSGTVSTAVSGDTLTITGIESDNFKTIAVSGQDSIVADSATGTFTLVNGGINVITTNATGDTITVTATEAQLVYKTVATDGSSAVADTIADTLTLAGGGINVTSASTDTVTITATEAQTLWHVIDSDSGSTTADFLTDTITIAGGGIASTAVVSDTLTVTATEADTLATVVSRGSDASSTITVSTPTVDGHAATKAYVDNAVGFQFDYFWNDTASDIGGIYYQMTDNDLGGAESTISTVIGSTGSDKPLINFATLSGEPGITKLDIGIYEIHTHAAKTAGGSTVDAIYVELYKYEVGTSETLLGTSELSGAVSSKAGFNLHMTITSAITLVNTDRLVVKLYANLSGGAGATVAIYPEGDGDCHLSFSVSSAILSDVFLRQDGTTALTANWDAGSYDIRAQTGTFDSLTSGRVAFISTNGLLIDDADMTFSTDTLTVTKLGAYEATGAINFANQNMTNVDIDSGTANALTSLSTSSGNVDFTVGAAEKVTVTASAHTSVAGAIDVDTTTATANVSGISSEITLTGDVNAVSGIVSSVTGLSTGGGSGYASFGFTAVMNGDDNDTGHNYVAFEAGDFTDNGGTSYGVAHNGGTDWDFLLLGSSGDICFEDYDVTISAVRGADGNGNNITLAAGDGLGAGARNGGTLTISGGSQLNGGTDGVVDIDSDWNAASQTCSDLGIITTIDLNGGTINGITDLAVVDGGTGQSNLNDLITLTTHTTGNYATSSSEGGEATTFNCTDNENENIGALIVFVDGATGSQGAETDGDIIYNPSTGTLTSPIFAGNVTGNVTGNCTGTSGSTTGNAATATILQTGRTIGGVSFNGSANITPANIAVTDESSDTICNIAYFTEATGNLPPKTGSNITFNSSTGVLQVDISGDVTGALTGQADTVATITGLAPDTATTQATQGNITSLGTLTVLQIDDLNFNGTTMSTDNGTDLNITPFAGEQIVLDGTIIIDAGVITGATSISSTGFTGALTGNADTCTTASAGDAAVDFFGGGVDAVTDATTCTDIEGTLLSIAAGTLNCTEAQTLDDVCDLGAIVSDDTLIDLSAINMSDAAEGLILPQANDVSAGTAEGQISWDADNDILYMGDSLTTLAIGQQTFAAVLALGADGNDVDQTSLGKLEFFDAGLYIDADADGVMDITSDGTLELHSNDWDISTTGAITNTAIDADNNTVTNIVIGAECTGASTALTDTADLLYEAELDTFSELDSQIADKSLINLADGGTFTGNIIANANLSIGNATTTAGVLTLLEDDDDGANFASFMVPALAANTVYTLPVDDGDNTEVLQTNGSGTLEWVANGGGVTPSGNNNEIITDDGASGIVSESNLIFDGNALTVKGSSPSATIGDAGEEDTKVVFDGNEQDYYIGLDDTDNILKIGLGSAVGTTAHITSDEAGVVTLPLQSSTSLSTSADQLLKTTAYNRVMFDTEDFDQNNDFNSSKLTSTATTDSLNHVVDSSAPFVAGDVGKRIFNSTDTIWAEVTVYNSATDVTCNADVCPDGNEAYTMYSSFFTAPTTGLYLIIFTPVVENFDGANDVFKCLVRKNGATTLALWTDEPAGATQISLPSFSTIVTLTAADYLEIEAQATNNDGTGLLAGGGSQSTRCSITKIA